MLRFFHSNTSFRVASRTNPLLRAPPYLRPSSVISRYIPTMPPKRKRSAVATATPIADGAPSSTDKTQIRKTDMPLPPNVTKPALRQSSRGGKSQKTDPNLNPDILDGATALRASPDGHEDAPIDAVLKPPLSNGTAKEASCPVDATTEDKAASAPATKGEAPTTKNKRKKAGAQQVKVEHEEDGTIGAVNGVAEDVTAPAASADFHSNPEDADGAEAEEGDEIEVKEALSRPPPVNSDYLPLPWKGRLGYVCILQVLFNLN